MDSVEQPTAPAPTPEPVPPHESRPVSIGRFTIGFNVAVQILVVIFITLLVNNLGFRHYKRWDFSHNQKFALSPQTKNVIAHLESPVHAIIFFPQAQGLFGDASALLREYSYASHGKFTVEEVDPYRNLIRARELSEKYKFGSSDNIVILDYKGKSKFVNAQDMAEMDMSQSMMGQPPTMKAFKGEEAITSAMMELTEEKQNKLYFVEGHGEAPLNGQVITGLKEFLKRQNIKADPLSLNNVDAVPADASGLFIFGPKSDFSEREMKLISDFWDKKGRLFILLDPTAKTPRLNEFLASQGVTPQGDRVLKTGTVLQQNDDGQLVLKTGVIVSPAAKFVQPGKEVTKDVADQETQLLGATESFALDKSKAQTDKIKLITLMESGEGFWGSTTYTSTSIAENKQTYFDPKKDHMGPLPLAVAVERGALEDSRVKVDTARMIAIGNAGFLTDAGLQAQEIGADFAMNAVNWMFNREAVAGIAAKPKEPVKLNLNENQLNNLAVVLIIVIPLLVAAVGVIVWTQRRS